MTKCAPSKADVFDDLVAEILRNYGSGRAAIAVDSISGAGAEQVAYDLVATFERVAHPASANPVAADLIVADIELHCLAGRT